MSAAVAGRASPLSVLGDLGAVAEAGAVRRRPLSAVRVHATRSVLVWQRHQRMLLCAHQYELQYQSVYELQLGECCIFLLE